MELDKPVWAKNDFIPMKDDDDGYIFEMFRYIKFAYMLIQKALYDRPVIFQKVSGRRISCGHSGHGKKKQKRKVRAVKVMRIQSGEFQGYVKTQRKITCPSWGVIGHWRNYKLGKKVWINPYRKGRERNNTDKYQCKEYLLENGGNADA